LITILNDGAMLTLAYDNVIPSPMPCKWHMTELICQSVIMGIVSAGQNILILLIGLWACSSDSWWTKTFFITRTNYPQVLGMVYIAKSIAGFMSVFTSRTGVKPWFVRTPGKALMIAALVANGLTVVFACTWPFSGKDTKYYDRIDGTTWRQTLFVVIWCLLWFLIQDFVKCVFLYVWHKVGKTGLHKGHGVNTGRSSFWAVTPHGNKSGRSNVNNSRFGVEQDDTGSSVEPMVSNHTMISVNRQPQSEDPHDHEGRGLVKSPKRKIDF